MLGRFLLLVAGDHEATPHEVGRDAEEGGAAGEERGAEECAALPPSKRMRQVGGLGGQVRM